MVVQLALYFLACTVVALLGLDRKLGFWGYFFIAVFFTPLTGLVATLVGRPKEPPRKGNEVDIVARSQKMAYTELQLISELLDDNQVDPTTKVTRLRYRLEAVLPLIKLDP